MADIVFPSLFLNLDCWIPEARVSKMLQVVSYIILTIGSIYNIYDGFS